MPNHPKILVDTEARTLTIPHLGTTLRRLIGAAAASLESQEGLWNIIYKQTQIGTVTLKHFSPKEPS